MAKKNYEIWEYQAKMFQLMQERDDAVEKLKKAEEEHQRILDNAADVLQIAVDTYYEAWKKLYDRVQELEKQLKKSE